MKAIVRIPFRGVPDDEHHGRDFDVGDTVAGDLARVAVEQGWAIPEGNHAPVAPKEHQALGGAPEPFRETPATPVRRRRERA